MLYTKILFFSIIFNIKILALGIEHKKLPLPRFASIKSNEANARVGPSIKSPIEWVFIKKGEPVKIISEYEQWRQIIDVAGEGGWVHSSVLSGKRSVIIINTKIADLLKYPCYNAKVLAKIHKNVRCLLHKCKIHFCQLTCNNKTGWILKKVLWGINQD